MGAVVPIGEARSRRTATAAPPSLRDGERLYTTVELSRILSRSTRSIRRDVEQGCPRVPVGLAHHRFILDDVLAWHHNRQENAGPDHQASA